MGFLSSVGGILGGVVKVAAPVVGGIVGGPAGAAAGLALSKGISSLQQSAQAKALEKQNVRPVDAPESEYYQNEAEANANAQNGMNSQQYNNQQDNIQRNQNAGFRAAGRTQGGNLAAITGLVDSSNRADSQLNAQDEAERQQNQRIAMQARNQLAMRKAQAFNWNFKDKFLENAAAIRGLKGAAAQNAFGAIQSGADAFAGSGYSNLSPATGTTATTGITGATQDSLYHPIS